MPPAQSYASPPQMYSPPQQSPPMMPQPQPYMPPSTGGGYAQPPPPPPPSGYATSPGGGYRRRNKRDAERKGTSDNVECNNDELKETMKKVMTNDETETRSKISAELAKKDSPMAVFCTSNTFKFTISNSADFCAVKGEKFTCYAFVATD
ncbi:ground-like domain protein [Ancylostoma duodenale]|uniref:Ground-like domain protein n=1 Tax=Ancylostoma duodenale TaxID=51022 RepID=A0A0C2H0H2_9BILA|nr:ground-like domain protein [Ancylostoma duodenale]